MTLHVEQIHATCYHIDVELPNGKNAPQFAVIVLEGRYGVPLADHKWHLVIRDERRIVSDFGMFPTVTEAMDFGCKAMAGRYPQACENAATAAFA